jgi:hypothetical protein
MDIRIMIGAAIVATAWCQPGLAQDAGQPQCGSFVVTWVSDERDFVDNAPPGLSAGDVRLNESDLMIDGKQVGTSYRVGTVVPSTKGDLMIGQIVDQFDNGEVMSMAMPHGADLTDTAKRAVEGTIDFVVLGGTGAFVGARGQITSTVGADGTRQATYDLRCD